MLVVDYDDAVFHRYDLHRSPVVRAVLGKKIDRIMQRANLTTAGNAYLADHAIAAGSQCVEWLPTVIDLDRYPLTASPREEGAVVVGWIGSPSTAGYLREVSVALAPLQAAGRIRCVAVGARADQVLGTPFLAVEWHEETEVAELQRFDIGIMPLRDDPWARGKCGYKLIQYMACGLPVVASPVGVNTHLVTAGENGFLASTPDQWAEAVDSLAADAELRSRMGQEGRRRVEESYCLQVQSQRLVGMFNRISNGANTACAG
jgi:glycosyltransferase involved in cell wall biosynthesis